MSPSPLNPQGGLPHNVPLYMQQQYKDAGPGPVPVPNDLSHISPLPGDKDPYANNERL